MASFYVFKNLGHEFRCYAIDRAVGRNAPNVIDDVQLIQVLINRYAKVAAENWIELQINPALKDPRNKDLTVRGRNGKQIDDLVLDGLCGPRTLEAIVATQKSLNIWKGSAEDGVISPLADGAEAQYADGGHYLGYGKVNGHWKSMQRPSFTFRTMYILAVKTQGYHGDNLNLIDLPDPLRSALMRSAIGVVLKPLTAMQPVA